ncbi:MAG: hypothetical protein ACX936_21100, partial [Marinobacter sp.]
CTAKYKAKYTSSTNTLYIVMDLIRRGSVFEGKLRKDSNGTEDLRMIAKIMTVNVRQDIEVFESSIDCLVATTDPLLQDSAGRDWVMREAYVLRTPGVSAISFHLFTGPQGMHQRLPENGNICILSARKGAIDPDDVTRGNANGNFVAQPRSIELVREPTPPERRRI